jgi:hypothetical protein
MAMNPSLAKAVGQRQVWVSGSNLFAVSAQYLNDATQWYRIAQLDNLYDPWIGAPVLLNIPEPQSFSNGGILGL